MRTLDADPTIRRWERCRSLWIPYVDLEGQRRGYNPDFIVERVDGTKEIHEVKGGHLMASEETRKKLEAAEKFCRKRGMMFKVTTKKA